jgi:hypothetical protein
MKSMSTNKFALFMLLALLTVPLFGQTVGDITGEVTDPSGAILVGATVTATNPLTGATRQTVTNTAGNYSFPALQPGTYVVKVEMQGFAAEVRNGVELQVQQVARIDFRLRLGDTTETVEVSGGAALLTTENATVGTVIENQRIVDLPLNGRNFIQLVSLSPNVTSGFNNGATPSARMGGDRATQAVAIAGQRREFTNYTLDGISNTDVNFDSYILLPSIDLIQEFKVQTGVYSAEFGRETNQVNVSTKSGTNDYHGTLFEFLRNSALDARLSSGTSSVLLWEAPLPFRSCFTARTVCSSLPITRVFGCGSRFKPLSLLSQPPCAPAIFRNSCRARRSRIPAPAFPSRGISSQWSA